jgi:replicative DNA helicase
MNEIEWQEGALYSAIWGQANELFSIVSVEDFDPGYRQDLAEIVHRGTIEAPQSLQQFVADETQKKGKDFFVYSTGIMTAGFTGTAGYYGNKVREQSTKRYLTKVLNQGLGFVQRDYAPEEVSEFILGGLAAMPKPADNQDDAWTLEDIMSLEQKTEDFTLPKILKKNERLVLTGSEGGGKSVFVYQLLTGAAFGVDTFTLEKIKPSRVLFIDVENNEFQARGNLDKIVPSLKEISPEVIPEWYSLKRRVVDLMSTKDRAEIIRRVVHYNPDILYMGTAYKLTDVSDEAHRSVRAIQSVVDRIRQEIQCSVIVEHHAGHGHMNDRNNMRPEGSSYWLRWPDFGYGMQPLKTNTGARLMRLGAWRGDRASDREFPVAVKQSSVMPWQPIYADEWEAIYAHHYDN